MPIELYGSRSPLVLSWWDWDLEYVKLAIWVEDFAKGTDDVSNVSNAQYELKLPATDDKIQFNISPYIRPFTQQGGISPPFWWVHIWSKTKLTTGFEDGSWTHVDTILMGPGYNYSYQQDDSHDAVGRGIMTFKGINAGDSPNSSEATATPQDGAVHNTDRYILADVPYFVAPKNVGMTIPVRYDINATQKAFGVNYRKRWSGNVNIPSGSIIGQPVISDRIHSLVNYAGNPDGLYHASAEENTDLIYRRITYSSVADWVAVVRTHETNKVYDILQGDYDEDFVTAADGDTDDLVPEPISYLEEPIEMRRVETCDDSGTGKKWSKLLFVNKYGVIQDFYMFGNMVVETVVQRDSFSETNRIGSNTEPWKHTIGTKVKKATRRYTINTGRHYDERYNETFAQIMLSENMWLFDNRDSVTSGTTPPIKPVRLISSDWKYNTDNFKLRDYQFVFEDAEEYIDLNV